ncbi:relaxase/mobilization nuclease domain-containing protein (plasmid) [Halovibrio sp. HP20-59]|nr:relaxase/mobilization nuclease domain-containing protein [Halovibrio sp. HP20-59]MEA2120555.1 relaxase/mobilization nuclease domain-containing protein [Halovibrio sp. HP20-59]
MIVKFTPRGTGRGSGPVGYLLGQGRDREGAELLRGDPDQTEALIDSSNYAKRYTSGVLSFQEPNLDAATKATIMETFEQALLPGLDADQYDCLWVEHRDKGRLELNFVVPNVELTSGKRLQPYYDKADRPRIDAWKTLTNDTYGLHDPNDPANQRALTYPANLPRDRVEAQRKLTDGLLRLAERGEITNRNDVVAALEGAGFDVTRQTKTSLSIADPSGGKPLRLRGKLYERDFQNGDGLRAEIERASREYRAGRQERVEEARTRLAVGIERKREDNQRRYPRPEPAPETYRTVELAGRRHSSGLDAGVGRRSHLGNELAYGEPSRPDSALQHDIGAAEGRGWSDSTDGVRERDAEDVRGDRHRSESMGPRGAIPDTEGLLNDRTRAGAIARLRRFTGQLRETAAGMATRLREFADHVRGNPARQPGLKTPGDELEQSGQRLDRERVALDARGQEVMKQRQRGRDFGM